MSTINTFGKIGQVNGLSPERQSGLADAKGVKGEGFRETLRQVRDQAVLGADGVKGAQAELSLKFSGHAIDRMRNRGISYGPEALAKLNQAVEKAAAKGAKETLVLTDNSALIVSVKNNTVVTVMDKGALKDNVFTNIDSTVVI
ncbi:MAG: hypothetical protein H6624_19190 [Bdellovibrionaceae bacterium]|nr:hypothetical protein [Pseudobdellovibrionaceae bacterium]